MSLVEHLQELRSRLAKALLAIFAGAIVGFIFFHPIFRLLEHPYCRLPQHDRALTGCKLIFTGPLDAFIVRVKVAAIGGVVLASPVWLYQLWGFITPALRRHERRFALSFVLSSLVLFAGGATLAFLTLNKALGFLLSFGGSGLQSLLDINRYLAYVQAMLFIFGVSFELPLVLVMLNLAGVLPAARLRKWRRWAIFLIFAFAAVATPSQDALTMLALAVPMTVLYEAAVVVARIHDRRRPPSPYAGLDPDSPSPLPDATEANEPSFSNL
ncbi:MAG: twin-arginine translocase subunit TatC [Mycobacteriales bacterium]